MHSNTQIYIIWIAQTKVDPACSRTNQQKNLRQKTNTRNENKWLINIKHWPMKNNCCYCCFGVAINHALLLFVLLLLLLSLNLFVFSMLKPYLGSLPSGTWHKEIDQFPKEIQNMHKENSWKCRHDVGRLFQIMYGILPKAQFYQH